jgi:hypothetical protein
MAKRKIREERSKVFGTKQVLTSMNKAAHEEEHRTPTSGSPAISSFVSAAKWGFGEASA